MTNVLHLGMQKCSILSEESYFIEVLPAYQKQGLIWKYTVEKSQLSFTHDENAEGKTGSERKGVRRAAPHRAVLASEDEMVTHIGGPA